MSGQEVVKAVEALVLQNEEMRGALRNLSLVAGGYEAKQSGTVKPKRVRNRLPSTKQLQRHQAKQDGETPKARGRKPKFSDAEAAEMASRLKAGGTLAELAAAYGANVQTIQRTVARVSNGAHA